MYTLSKYLLEIKNTPSSKEESKLPVMQLQEGSTRNRVKEYNESLALHTCKF